MQPIQFNAYPTTFASQSELASRGFQGATFGAASAVAQHPIFGQGNGDTVQFQSKAPQFGQAEPAAEQPTLLSRVLRFPVALFNFLTREAEWPTHDVQAAPAFGDAPGGDQAETRARMQFMANAMDEMGNPRHKAYYQHAAAMLA